MSGLTPHDNAMTQRGRPPKIEGAQTPAQRKAAQRERERAALHAKGADVGELSTTALVEGLPGLIAGKHAGALGVALVELGRRGGVAIKAVLAVKPAKGDG